MYLINDIGSSISRLFLCYVGCFVNCMAKLNPLEESLLNGDSSVCNNSDSSETRVNKNLTRYSNAGFFSAFLLSHGLVH